MLTGLVNRRGFLALAEKSFALAQRKGQVLSFVMADIDRFKNVNDTYGHEIGDEILRGVVERLVEGLRMEDVCCRYGGEEFLVMLYDTDASRTALVAERLRRMIAEKPFAVAGKEIPITISFGVTDLSLEGDISPHDRGTEIQRVIQRADALLHHAKKTGRNKVSAESCESFERPLRERTPCVRRCPAFERRPGHRLLKPRDENEKGEQDESCSPWGILV